MICLNRTSTALLFIAALVCASPIRSQLVAAPQSHLSDTASVRGVVVALGTLQPVSKAVVQLSGGGRSEPLAVATGVDGRFEFQNLAAGSYELTATRGGYLNTSFGQRGPSGAGHALTIEAGASINDVRLLMTATGVISGRVFDDTGEPLANVPVQALKYSYLDGQRTLTPVKGAETNDLGEFRIFWLPPGQYYINAQPQDGGFGKAFMIHDGIQGTISLSAKRIVVNGSETNSTVQQLGEAYVPVYYPGTADPQSASRVEVRSGADVRGIDFSLARVRTRKIRGAVIDGATGQAAQSVNVQLVPRGAAGAALTPSYAPSDGGRFEISGLLPGSYYLVATARLGSPDDVRLMGGRTPVDIGNSDLDNLVVTLRPAIDIGGSVTVEGRADGLPPDSHPVVTLDGGRDGALSAMVYASFSSGTQFKFNSVIEGDYQVRWSDLPPGMYLKSVRLGPADALNGSVQIDSRTTASAQIVVGADGGTLEGVVLDKLRNAIAGARVAVVPDVAHRQRADLYVSTTSDESGRFRLQGIPPGDYSLFAWEDIEEGLWRDSEFIRRNEASGKPVRVTENSHETIETIAIPFAF